MTSQWRSASKAPSDARVQIRHRQQSPGQQQCTEPNLGLSKIQHGITPIAARSATSARPAGRPLATSHAHDRVPLSGCPKPRDNPRRRSIQILFSGPTRSSPSRMNRTVHGNLFEGVSQWERRCGAIVDNSAPRALPLFQRRETLFHTME